MKIKRITPTKPTIQQFAEERDLTMIVEQTEHQVMAYFEGVAVSNTRAEKARGQGPTEAAAIQAYMNVIQGQTITYPSGETHMACLGTCPQFAPYVADPAPEQQAPKIEQIEQCVMAGRDLNVTRANGQITGTVDGALAIKIDLATDLSEVIMTTVGFTRHRLIQGAAEIKCVMLALEMVASIYPEEFKKRVGEL